MHYHAEIWLKTKEDFEDQIIGIMEPYNEENQVMLQTDEWTDDNGKKQKEF